MAQRPYFRKSIKELEDIVSDADTPELLQGVADELRHRETRRANNLAEHVKDQLLGMSQSGPGATAQVTKPSPPISPASNDTPASEEPDEPEPDIEKFSIFNLEDLYKNKAVNTSDPVIARLASWSALEALSPQTYRRPEDLASDGRYGVAKLNEGLPWTRGERSRKNYKLYYEVVLGAIDMDMADEKLAAIFGKDEEKQRRSNSKAVIASILVDKDGYPVPEACAVSSFAWAFPLALEKRLDVLSNWPQIEQKLKNHLDSSCARQDKEGNALPLDTGTIMQAYEWLLEQLQIPKELSSPPEFSLRQYQYFKSQDAPECSLLNSFFIEDLSKAIEHYQDNTIGNGLRKYLGLDNPADAYDLLRNEDALEKSVCPKTMPAGRWPMGSNRALALLQQATVNLTTDKNEPIMSVNGPPGTGKTTLLRDIISDIIVKRAGAMADFENPLQAFEASGVKVSTGQKGFWHIYKLDPKIKGYEILVASSNNAAVENISHELPDIGAVARGDASHFRTVSDAIANAIHDDNDEDSIAREPTQSWGLIAAALGNMKNRAKFQKTFWWHEDAAMRLYLKAAKGDNVVVEKIDEQTGKVIERRRPPHGQELCRLFQPQHNDAAFAMPSHNSGIRP